MLTKHYYLHQKKLSLTIGFMGLQRVGHDWETELNGADRVITGFPVGSMVKTPPANAEDTGDMGSIPESERSPREGNGNPLQHSCWNIPWAEEPGEPIVLQRVRHDWECMHRIYNTLNQIGTN